MILGGAASAPRDLALVRRQARDRAGVVIRDMTSGWCGLGVWGPRATALLAPLTGADLSPAAFPPVASRELFVAGIPCLALRLSYVGEDGWELHAPTEYGGALWDALWAAGEHHGLRAIGGGAVDSLRLERGFRSLGTELTAERTPHEAGLGFAVSRIRTDYVGYRALAEHVPEQVLSCLVLDDPGVMLMGKEPILEGNKVVGYVTSAEFGYTIGVSIGTGYLPVSLAVPGMRLAVEYFGARTGATVAAEPLYGGGMVKMGRAGVTG